MTVTELTIETEADVTALWRTAMGDLGFSHRQLWYVFVDVSGTLVPLMNTIDELPRHPDPEQFDQLGWAMRQLRDLHAPHGRVAMLYVRPGRGPITADDAHWIRQIVSMSEEHRLLPWPIHFGNDSYIKRVAPDDLC